MRNNKFYLFTINVFIIFIFFISCVSTPKQTEKNDILRRSNEYYEGIGGKGIKLAIIEPEYRGLNSQDSWIPLFIQGILTNNFNIFSEITVLDRQYLERVLFEQKLSLSGYFSDNEYIRIGNLTNAKYILVGTLFNISTSEITVQLSVIDTETGETKGSYTKNCVLNDIKDASILNEATVQLLSHIGVQLTENGRDKILSHRNSTINAETALARGIMEQKNGTIVKALSYFYDATTYNPELTEALERRNIITTQVRSGNIGENVRNEIQERDSWINIIKECEDFFRDHLPFELVYSTNLKQREIDYINRTVNLEFVLGIYQSERIEIVNTILAGLKRTKKKEIWGIYDWPLSSKIFADSYGTASMFQSEIYGTRKLNIEFALLNDNGDLISRANIDFYKYINFESSFKFWRVPVSFLIPFGTIMISFDGYRVNNPYKIVIPFEKENITFRNVPANAITDNLIIRVIKINGIDAEQATNSGYIRISSTNRRL